MVLIDHYSCGRGAVRERRRERTRSGGTEPARHPVPEAVQVSGGTDGVVRPPWIPRSPRHAERAGASTRLAAAYEADARSLPRTALTRPAGSISRGGSVPQSFRRRIPHSLYTVWSIYVSRHICGPRWKLPFGYEAIALHEPS